jgi:DNA-binding CsgD family transcriptional regulator
MDYWTRVLEEVRHRYDANFKKCFVHFPDREKDVRVSNKVKENPSFVYDRRHPKRYFLGDKYPGLYLTARELECMHWFFKGYSYAGMAIEMQLSVRTIECYFGSVRLKLCCDSRDDLQDLIVETDLVQYLPH